MRRPPNRWYLAIDAVLREAGGPLTVEQILKAMAEEGFQHTSKVPRATLSARLVELAQLKKVERVGRSTYRLASNSSSRFVVTSESGAEIAAHANAVKEFET